MESKVFVLILLSSVALLAQAFSVEEAALRRAITSKGPVTYTLTKDIVLTAHLPKLANGKTLIVKSADASAPFKIDGDKKFHLFRSRVEAIVDLTLVNLVITRARTAAVKIGGEGTKLLVSTVTFSNQKRALDLYVVNAKIENSEFIGHKRTAIVTFSEEGLGDDVSLFLCKFTSNKAEKGLGGGAIRVLRYASITADKCSFTSNSADFVGGAVRVYQGFAKITRSGFYNNVAVEEGGGLSMYSSGLQTWDTTFSGNVARTGAGGAVRITSDDEGSYALFGNVNFSNNKAKKLGGAFLLNGTSEAVFCSQPTFSGNIGGGVASNGLVSGVDNILSTGPRVTVPLVTVEPGAALVRNTKADCTRV